MAKSVLEAGVDEAGRGSWAGPVVAACVLLNPTVDMSLLADSKILSPHKRQTAYDMLIKNCAYGIGVVDNRDIDTLGIKKATQKAMQIAVDALDIQPKKLLVDGIDRFSFSLPSKCIVRGDATVPSISAASIIAKVWRDHLMTLYHQEYPQYFFDRHKGYGTKLHHQSLLIHGPSPLHRFTFRPIKECADKKRT